MVAVVVIEAVMAHPHAHDGHDLYDQACTELYTCTSEVPWLAGFTCAGAVIASM